MEFYEYCEILDDKGKASQIRGLIRSFLNTVVSGRKDWRGQLQSSSEFSVGTIW